MYRKGNIMLDMETAFFKPTSCKAQSNVYAGLMFECFRVIIQNILIETAE